MKDLNKVCGTCKHIRPCLGIVGRLDFQVKLKRLLHVLQLQCEAIGKAEEIKMDRSLFEVLALLHWMARQKIYCKKERSWTHFFDQSCYAWQLREELQMKSDEVIPKLPQQKDQGTRGTFGKEAQ